MFAIVLTRLFIEFKHLTLRDQIYLQVTVPEGSLCNLNLRFKAGLPPDAVYNIIIDPENKRVFKNIKVRTCVVLPL